MENVSGFSRSVRILIPRMLVPLYEIRNNRNVGHVGGDVDPSHMDALCVVSMAKWILAELVRLFHAVDTGAATIVVESLIEREVPVIWEADGQRRVLQPGLSTRDKVLLLLYATPEAVKDADLMSWIEYGHVSRFRSNILGQAHSDRLVEYNAKTRFVRLSPLGMKYVEENLPLSAIPFT